jgi:integrase
MQEAPGYLFKRWRGKHIAADSPIAAVFYLSYEIDTHRTTVCLRTKDRETAQRLAKEHMGRIDWGSREAYLRSLIDLGDKAKRELWGMAHDTAACPTKEIWDRYVASRRRPDSGPSTMTFYQQHVKAFVDWLPAACKTMRHVTTALTEQYVHELEHKVSVPTASKHVGTLRRVWRVVDPDGPQPWRDLQPIGQHIVVPYRRLTLDECRQLALTAKEKAPDIYGCLLTGYYTALRLVDVIHLRTEHVDFQTTLLHLPAPRKTSRKKPAPLHIPMLPELADWLKTRIAAATSSDAWVFPALVERYTKDRTAVSKDIGGIFDDAKVLDNAHGKASFHSLRATFVSAMDEAGAPPRLTDIVTNHAPKTMHDRYSHPEVEDARKWMAKALKRLDGKPHKDKKA